MYYTLIHFSKRNGNNHKANDDPVPNKFVNMVKCALAKMAGAGFLDPDLINREFWRWFPTKMNNSKNYLKRTKKVFIILFLFIYLYAFFKALIFGSHLYISRKNWPGKRRL